MQQRRPSKCWRKVILLGQPIIMGRQMLTTLRSGWYVAACIIAGMSTSSVRPYSPDDGAQSAVDHAKTTIRATCFT
jgi:hypothetical protein